jgi:hypothetical protein
MKNAEAQRLYREEVEKLVRDLNLRYLRARLPELSLAEAPEVLDRILAGEVVEAVRPEDLLRVPHSEFLRRRGVPAFRMVGAGGEPFGDLHDYLHHLAAALPESYRAGRDYKDYVDALAKVQRGEMTAEAAASQMPALRRVGGACPCSKSVRWVIDAPAEAPPPPADTATSAARSAP